jgi:HSP20 family molecular chaperone IbpA
MKETTMTEQASQARDERAANDAALVPPVQVIENAQGITLYADLPGVSKDSLELNIEHDTVTIEGRLALDVPEGLEVTHAEVSIPRFRRVFTLSKELDANKIAAELVNGVLTLRIPKAEHAQPRRIPISG